MMTLKYLLEKEFKQFARNKFLPRMVIGFPFMSLLIFPLVANFDVKNLNLAVVDHDHSPYSRRLTHKTTASGYFRITDASGTYEQALTAIELDRADIILEIPAGFERDLVRDQTATVMVAANTVNGTRGGLGSAYLSGIVNDFAGEIRGEWLASAPRLVTPTFEIVPQYRFNPNLDYRVFMIPAIMVMMLTMVCGFLPALNIVQEKERGTMEQMNVTPVRRFTFILAKLIPYWVIGFVTLTICFGVAWMFYGMTPAGSLGTIYLFASAFILAISGLGLVISNYARTIQQGMFMMFFFVVTMILMGGLYTPVASMPGWAQTISDFLPLKYFIIVMRAVYLKGSDTAALLKPLAALSCFAVAFYAWAIVSYRKRT